MSGFFKSLEKAKSGDKSALDEVLSNLKYNEDGLVPAIAQQHDTKEVLMMAWMNRAAIEETLKNQRVCYWSRSRQKFWRKGEESGNVQELKDFRIDCDGDTILLLVNQIGPACHTGRENCFYHRIDDQDVVIDNDPVMNPDEMYKK